MKKKNCSETLKKIIVPPELTKKLDFTINHLNNEQKELKKSFSNLEKDLMLQINNYEFELDKKYNRVVQDSEFIFSIS